jgi:carbon-monoxide dehydrogenase medium subunit
MRSRHDNAPVATLFSRARSCTEAIELLAEPESRLLAGGQTLVAMMNLGYFTPGRLVYLGGVPELAGIARQPDGSARIGAMATHAEIAASTLFTGGQRLLAHTAAQIADPGVRNRGTLGGACAHGDPVTDWPAALVAAGAAFELAGPQGTRTVAAGDFFLGLMSTALAERELIVAVRVPAIPGNGHYRKLARAEGDFATVSVAATVHVEKEVRSVSIAVGACGPRPVRLEEAERRLVGRPLEREGLLESGRLLAEAIEPLDDVRASAAYRRRVLPHLVAEAVMAAA